jgi:solute carrier family 25 (mitochondrial carnitine/acylcarnitine transporter), member 20/29
MLITVMRGINRYVDKPQWTMDEAHRAILAGSLSGMAAVTVCHPFDVLRTKIQTSSHLSVSVAIRSTFNQGLSSLYQGFAFPFIAQTIYKSVIFSTNTLSKQYIFQGDTSKKSLLLSGIIAGSVNATIVAPVEIVRTHQILSNNTTEVPTIIQVLKNLKSKFGLSVLWTGLIPTILRDGPGIGLYLLAFEETKRILISKYSTNQSTPTLWMRVVSGSVAGVAFWTWAIPIDTIKTKIESAYKQQNVHIGGFQIASKVSKDLSLIGMYRALPLAYMRGIPSATVTLTVYDMVMDSLQSHS